MNNSFQNPIIEINKLSKIYRLYHKPNHRFLDMLGLLRGKNRYTEYTALNNISLQINRGEKIAVIGRNGAGKSTLLKIISKIIEPTHGQVTVKGQHRALLQIGSGFHPEFTGRENSLAYLAHLGVSDFDASNLLHEIIEFTELEEYIDQPLKTYSTGMTARLMFATSTAITPELLILDEILSVGDAYFTHKSMERIQTMCESHHTTLLLVSHDIYTCAKICNRMIWLDRGSLVQDDNPRNTMRAYESSIRAQEEARLRKKLVKTAHHLLIEITTADGNPLSFPVYFSTFILKKKGIVLMNLTTYDNVDNNPYCRLIFENSCWGDTLVHQGKYGREMKMHGSLFNKISTIFEVNEPMGPNDEYTIEFESTSPKNVDLLVKGYRQAEKIVETTVHLSQDSWENHTVRLCDSHLPTAIIPHTAHTIYGNGAFRINSVIITNGDGKYTTVIEHGSPMSIHINYTVIDKNFNDSADIIIAILRDGIETVCRFFNDKLNFTYHKSSPGLIQLEVPECLLGLGKYSITVLIARKGYNQMVGHKFFSINPDVYLWQAELFEFTVVGEGLVLQGTPVLGKGTWKKRANHAIEEPS